MHGRVGVGRSLGPSRWPRLRPKPDCAYQCNSSLRARGDTSRKRWCGAGSAWRRRRRRRRSASERGGPLPDLRPRAASRTSSSICLIQVEGDGPRATGVSTRGAVAALRCRSCAAAGPARSSGDGSRPHAAAAAAAVDAASHERGIVAGHVGRRGGLAAPVARGGHWQYAAARRCPYPALPPPGLAGSATRNFGSRSFSRTIHARWCAAATLFSSASSPITLSE